MSVEIVNWKDMIEDWQKNPEKLISFILDLIWRAGIKPEDKFGYSTKDKKVILET